MALIHRHWIGIEFVGICIPFAQYPFTQDPNPGSIIIPTTSKINIPYSAPYAIYWDINNNPVYYKMSWNLNLTLRCGLAIYFNIILGIISAS